MSTYKQLRLKKRPSAGDFLSVQENYEVVTLPLPQPSDLKHDDIIGKVVYLSCDPTLRIWTSDAKQYMAPVQIGETMRAFGLGQVVHSNNKEFAVGDFFTGLVGWSEYVVGNPTLLGFHKDFSGGKADITLGPCGLTGWTAYIGFFLVGKPVAGDNILVSGAAGATGSIVVQLAKIAGCRVVAIAGGPEKCKLVKGYGADEVIDYKSENLQKRVAELAGNGYDVYFDNVGGESLEAALDNLALGARIVLCGAIEGYNTQKSSGPSNYTMLLMKRASITGFIVLDFADKIPTIVTRIAQWIKEGKIKYDTDIQEGPLENAVEILNRVYTGKNMGKQLHKLT